MNEDIFISKVESLGTKYKYQVPASRPVMKNSDKIDWRENDEIMERYKYAASSLDRQECILQIINNFDSYFRKYIKLFKRDYRTVLSKDTLLFVSLFVKSDIKQIGQMHINKACGMFQGLLHNYTEADLMSEFHIMTIELMDRYRKRKDISFTAYFIKLFRFRLANFIRTLSPDFGNSLAFSDNILNAPHLEKRIKAYHENYNREDFPIEYEPNDEFDFDIDFMWIAKGSFSTRQLPTSDRFKLYLKYVRNLTMINIAKDQHSSPGRISRIYEGLVLKCVNKLKDGGS